MVATAEALQVTLVHRDVAVNPERREKSLYSHEQIRRGGSDAHLMIRDPSFCVEIPPYECGTLFCRGRKHEVRDQALTTSRQTSSEDPSQEATEGE